MTVYLVNSMPKIPYMYRIYMVLANPTYTVFLAKMTGVFAEGVDGANVLKCDVFDADHI